MRSRLLALALVFGCAITVVAQRRDVGWSPPRLADGQYDLEGVWDFIALGDAGCKVAFALDFDYAGRLGGSALKLGFQGLAGRMVDDFCREAERVYG